MTPTFILLALSTGCGDNSVSDRSVQIRFGEPAELKALEKEKRRPTIRLESTTENQPAGLMIEPSVGLQPNPDGSVWDGVFKDLAPGRYQFSLKLVHSWDATSLLKIAPSLSTDKGPMDVTLSAYQVPIEVVEGQTQIKIDVAPGAFSLTIDDDGDELTNIQEILGNTNPTKADSDVDGLNDNKDNCPLIPNGDQKDSFKNGKGDACNPDIDADGIPNEKDNCPLVPNKDQKDLFKSGKGDLCNPDVDGDTIPNEGDNCPLVSNKDQKDSFNSKKGDACNPDIDGDSVLNEKDNCPFVSNKDQKDSFKSSKGDVCNPDIDGDRVLNMADNCPFVPNPGQGNVDGDKSGDLCDDDADGDGFSNTEEQTAGLDSLITNWLSADTDGDGIIDSSDKCSLVLDKEKEQKDSDKDREGDLCDLDPNDDNITTKKAVFVSTTGDDSKTGARNDPVKTIQRGIELAKIYGKPQVYVARGTYTGAITMADGISVLGGFDFSLGGVKALFDKGIETLATRITAPSGPVVTFNNIGSETHLEGVTVDSVATSGDQTLIKITSPQSSTNNIFVENSYLTAPSIPGRSVVAVDISGASPVFVNDIIDAGNSRESTAILLDNSPAPKFVNNTIRGGGSATTSTVLDSKNSSPSLVNNILFTEKGATQTILFFQDTTPSTSILVKNNLLFGVSVLELGVDAKLADKPRLYADKNPTALSTIDAVNKVSEKFSGNITTSSSVSDLFLSVDPLKPQNWRPKLGSVVIDKGIDPNDPLKIPVAKDRDSVARPQGKTWDLGAFERL